MVQVENKILDQLQRLDGYEFEDLVADLWERRGWETEVTSGSNDRGIDIIARRTNPYQEKVLIQVKRYQPNNTVGSAEIQQYSSLKQQEDSVDKVLVITTSTFSDPALSVADSLNVKCINGPTLAQLIDEYDAHDLFKHYGNGSDERLPETIHGNTETAGSLSNTTESPGQVEGQASTNSRIENRDYSGIVGTVRLLRDMVVIPCKAGYRDSVRKSQGNEADHSGKYSQQQHQGDENKAGQDKGTNPVARTDLVTAELTGLEWIQTTVQRSSRQISTFEDKTLHIEGVAATFRFIVSQTDEPPTIATVNQVTFYDNYGNEYHPVVLGDLGLPNEWKTHEKDNSFSSIELPPGGTINYLAAFSMPRSSKIEQIEFNPSSGDAFTFSLDHETRQDLPGLPSEIKDVL